MMRMAARSGKGYLVISLVVGLALVLPLSGGGTPPPSLVETPDQITDFEARLAIARLLASQSGEVGAAIREYRRLLAQRPGDSRIRIELADLLIRQNDFPGAIQELKLVVRQQPGNLKAAITLARLLLWTKHYAEAIQLLQPLQQRGRLNSADLAELARAYTWSKQYPQAIQTYQEALRLAKAPEAKLCAELGDVYLYTKNLPQAVTQYRKALELDPASDAIRKNLALALSWDKQDQEAAALLVPLHQKHPQDKEIGLELVRVYAKTGHQPQAVALARTLASQFPRDAGFLVELGDLELGLGHARAAGDLYDRALKLAGEPEKLTVHVADQMNMWGDFYRVEAIYRQYLQKHPDDFKVRLKLAWALVSGQRYEEAEGEYRRLRLDHPKSLEPLVGLAKLKLMEKDFAQALAYADEILRVKPNDPEGLALRGEAAYRLQRYAAAGDSYQRLAGLKTHQVQGLIGQGQVLLKQGRGEEAAAAFAQAYRLAPKQVEARYYNAGREPAASPEFVKNLTATGQETPQQLGELAQLYAADGFNRQAIACYEAALAQDPRYFPAQMGLAEILGVDHQYDRSIKMFQELAEEYPGDSKILISLARVLGWAKNYDRSLEVYRKVGALNPADPVPPKEMARTAAWGKMMPRAREIYASLQQPAVDQKLLTALQSRPFQGQDAEIIQDLLGRMRRAAPAGAGYQGYEVFSQALTSLQDCLSPETWKQLEIISLELLPAYKVQKAAYLESKAKWQAWNRRYTPSMDTYEELIKAQPGNQEAYFDYAQVQCAQGLCDREAKTYKELLILDPLHSRAGMALERQQIRSHPYLKMSHSYWEETGTGQHAVSQIARHKTDWTLDIPLACVHHLRLNAHRWFERPKDGHGGPYWADGQTLELTGIFNPYIKYALAWTGKYYEKSSVPNQNTGLAQLWFNLRNYAQLGLCYERTNEIYNNFGIRQGTQADNMWLALSSFITRKFEVAAQARYIIFNDKNAEQVYSLSGSYDVTDHPRVFRIKLKGEYRNTDHINDYIFQGRNLLTIVHPYWTPKNYLGGTLTLEWYHDLSKYYFCGSQQHFYALRALLGDDTTGNKGYGFEGEYNYEFLKHWTINAKGTIYRSSQWNAQGVWAFIKYQF